LVSKVIFTVLEKHHTLVELVFNWQVVCVAAMRVTNNAGSLPGANQERQRSKFNRQVIWENEQLLLALEKLVENQNRNTSDGQGCKN